MSDKVYHLTEDELAETKGDVVRGLVQRFWDAKHVTHMSDIVDWLYECADAVEKETLNHD